MKHVVDTAEVESGWMVLKGHDPNRRMVKATLVISDERVFTESEVRAMFQVLRSNEFFEDGGATLMHIDDFNARVQTFFSDPA